MNTAFLGRSKYVIPIIEVLKNKFNLSFIITSEKDPNEPVVKYAIENKIPYFSVSSSSDLTKIINSQASINKIDVCVLANLGLILSNSVLESFKYGVLNIHPSLLPKYRGPTPGQSAIVNGDKLTGVSLIKLDDQIDHGEILAQGKEEVLKDDTCESLLFRLFEKGSKLISGTIQDYINNKIHLEKQDDSKATFTKILTRDSGYFDYANSPTKEVLDKMIRAFHPWPGAWTRFILNSDGQEKVIKFLPNHKIQVEGKKPVNYKDFINGYPKNGKELLNKLNLDLNN